MIYENTGSLPAKYNLGRVKAFIGSKIKPLVKPISDYFTISEIPLVNSVDIYDAMGSLELPNYDKMDPIMWNKAFEGDEKYDFFLENNQGSIFFSQGKYFQVSTDGIKNTNYTNKGDVPDNKKPNMPRIGSILLLLALAASGCSYLAKNNTSSERPTQAASQTSSSAAYTATPSGNIESFVRNMETGRHTDNNFDINDYGIIKLVKCDDTNFDGICQAGEYIPGYELSMNGDHFNLPSSFEPLGILEIGNLDVPYELQGGNLFLYLPEGQYQFEDLLAPGWINFSGNTLEVRSVLPEDLGGELVNPPIIFVNNEVGQTATPTPGVTSTPYFTPTPWFTPTQTPRKTNTPYPSITPTNPPRSTPTQPSFNTLEPTDPPQQPTLESTEKPPEPTPQPTSTQPDL